MNPAVILALISDMYGQIAQLQAANKSLQEQLAAQNQPPTEQA